MKKISDARVYDNLVSPQVNLSELKEKENELRKKTQKMLTDYIADCKKRGDVDENGKVRFFPKICDTPDLILEQYPMTEEQILSVTDYDEGLLYDAIDFLHGDNKGKLASTMYLCIYAKYHGLKEL